ncbi:MAG: OmpA family protein [Polyangiaceae bacterium]|nr:OmpA family protein [Polyangiaceae bacterium]
MTARARRGLALAAAALALSGAVRQSAADPTPSLALEPAPAGDRGFAVERAAVRGHLLASARLETDYASEPLVLESAAQEIDRVVTRQIWLHALGSFAIAHRFVVQLDLPLVADQASGAAPISGPTAPRPGDAAELGDLRLGARAVLWGSAEEEAVKQRLAIAMSLWLPTAAEGYAGDGAARVRGALILDGESSRYTWAVNAGVRTRPTEALPGLVPSRLGTALDLGLAAGFFADEQRLITLGAELRADLTVAGGARLFDPRATVAHALLTGHYRLLGGPLEIGAAIGPGLARGAGSADYRVLTLIGYAPEEPPPPPDEDEDGIPDKVDACVDLDGEPSPDPLLHGCPEAPRDTDGDAIPDDNDACPKVPGIPTPGARRTHGCPRPEDADRDGVPDPDDACPDEAGAPPPGDGCPEPPAPPPAPPTTRLVEQQIELSQQVQFETGTAVLRAESDVLLGEVARVLAEHPEIELIEIQGHTDETGTPELNRDLGRRRAESVMDWLSARGVARQRLTAKGYGADRPIADNTTEEGRTKNRRVEFRVLRTKPAAGAPQGGPR